MPTSLKFVVLPYRKNKARLDQAEPRPVRSSEAAVNLAKTMALRYAGVAAYEYQFDAETGDTSDLRCLASHGTVPELAA